MRMTEYGQEAKIAGRCDTSHAISPTLDLVPCTGISLGPLINIKPSLGSEETTDRPKTGCRLHRATMEGSPGEETSAAPLSQSSQKGKESKNLAGAEFPGLSGTGGVTSSTFGRSTSGISGRCSVLPTRINIRGYSIPAR